MSEIKDKVTHKDQLYASNNGRVVCFQHLGNYGQAHVEVKPFAAEWQTPLDTWTVVTADDNDAWVRMLKTPMACEDCGKGGPW